MIKESKFIQYGFPRQEADILGITIHETNNQDMNARQLHDFLDNENKTSQGCHYIVDSNEIVQVMPDNWAVYHTGKGVDWGCKYTIAIEICSSINDDTYNKAEDRAISLIYNIQKKYHIPNDMIFFHQDFNERTYCPKTIIDKYKTSTNFVYQRLTEEN